MNEQECVPGTLSSPERGRLYYQEREEDVCVKGNSYFSGMQENLTLVFVILLNLNWLYL